MTKALLRQILPLSFVRFLGGVRAAYRQRRLSRLSTAEAFDEIYRRKMWKQSSSLSGPGSSGIWAIEFQRIVAGFIDSNSIRSLLDVGCGDFMVGAGLAPLVQSLLAMDVSAFIIEQNKATYASLTNVTFMAGDICESKLPVVDLIIIRQVLQHLSNSQIEKALINIQNSGAKYAIIAEHIMRSEFMAAPNLDIGSHSVLTRVGMKSGVIITSPPFSRPAKLLKSIEPDQSNLAEPDSVLAVFLMELQ
jgi:2-polyprenyl-3-methyl-5-hydroxy-6-metoxy-1,4-benzoquinol methylase